MPVTGRGHVCMDILQCKQSQTHKRSSVHLTCFQEKVLKVPPSSSECFRIHQAMLNYLSQALWQELSHVTNEDLEKRDRGVYDHVHHVWKQIRLGTHLNRQKLLLLIVYIYKPCACLCMHKHSLKRREKGPFFAIKSFQQLRVLTIVCTQLTALGLMGLPSKIIQSLLIQLWPCPSQLLQPTLQLSHLLHKMINSFCFLISTTSWSPIAEKPYSIPGDKRLQPCLNSS